MFTRPSAVGAKREFRRRCRLRPGSVPPMGGTMRETLEAKQDTSAAMAPFATRSYRHALEVLEHNSASALVSSPVQSTWGDTT